MVWCKQSIPKHEVHIVSKVGAKWMQAIVACFRQM
jgi:hypothetical protein